MTKKKEEKPNWIQRRFNSVQKKFKKYKKIWDDLDPEQQKKIIEGLENAAEKGMKLLNKNKKK